MTDDERPWTYQDVAEWFNRDVKTVRRWVAAGRLEALAGVRGYVTADSVRRLSTTPRKIEEDHAPRHVAVRGVP